MAKNKDKLETPDKDKVEYAPAVEPKVEDITVEVAEDKGAVAFDIEVNCEGDLVTIGNDFDRQLQTIVQEVMVYNNIMTDLKDGKTVTFTFKPK